MNTSLYSSLQRSAYQLIKSLGARTTINTVDSQTIKGYGVLLNADKTDVADTTITKNTKTVYFQTAMATLANPPGPGDQVTVGKKTWAIQSVEDLTPNGITTLLYKMEVLS